MDKITIKRGFESLCNSNPSIKDIEFEKSHLYKMQIGTKYCYYALDYKNHSRAPSHWGIFEAKIPKTEIDIIELLDSMDYDNFLIVKQLIKFKLKSYGK